MSATSAEGTSHAQTIAGIVLCAVGLIVAAPVIRILMVLFGGWPDHETWWLPAWLNQFAIRPTAGLSALITSSIVKRADRTVICYTVGAICICFFASLLAVIYLSGQAPNDLIQNTAHLIGTLVGLAMGFEVVK